MSKRFFSTFLLLAVFCLPSSAYAAPKKYFWGELAGTQGISFHRQGNNISEFHGTLPMHCEFTDGTSDDVDASISGSEVPNMLVRRNRVTAEFTSYVEGLLVDGDIEVTGRFRGNRATFSIVVNSSFSDGVCYGAIVYSSVRRGARIR